MNEAATGFFARLKARKLVQWMLAYVAAAFALIQVLDVVAQSYHWPDGAMHVVFGVLALGFAIALVLAWYHGERGAQKVSGTEVLILALLLAIGGAVLWRLLRVSNATGNATAASTSVSRASNMSTANASATSTSALDVAHTIPVPAKSIAVLPFENLSDEKGNAYFADGMQDLILTKLADIGDLKVISRTSTEKYKSHPDNLKDIAQQLGVATILEGSVQKAGNQVLINVQLIDANTDAHIWAQSYQRTLDNIFGVEGEVAQKVAAALKTRLSGAEAASLAAVPTRDQAALDLYLRAEYQSNQGLTNLDFDSWRAAISLYRQATTHDPAFALAYARMSYTESLMVWFGVGEVDVESLKIDASRDAARALSLAPGLAAAQVAIGYSDHFGSRDDVAAAKAFEAALSLKPNDPDALGGLGLVEFQQGHVQASVDLFQRAFALDPRSATRATQAGAACMYVFRYADAEGLLRRALALDPHAGFAETILVWAIAYGSGDIPRALTVASDKLQRVHLLTLERKYQAASSLLQGIPDTPDNFSVANSNPKALWQADLYRLMGDTAKARPLFEQALAAARTQFGKQPKALPKVAAWFQYNIAAAELGLGHTSQGLEAIAEMQALAARSRDRAFELLFMREAASLYAQAGRADLAVPLLEGPRDARHGAVVFARDVADRPGVGSDPAHARVSGIAEAIRQLAARNRRERGLG